MRSLSAVGKFALSFAITAALATGGLQVYRSVASARAEDARQAAARDAAARAAAARRAVAEAPVTVPIPAVPDVGAPAAPSAGETQELLGGEAAGETPIEQQYKPPQRGPGAVDDFDPKTAPVVPKGQTPDEYAAEYYEAILAEDWEKAASMVPLVEGKGVGGFKTALKGYEVEAYNILSSVEVGTEWELFVVQVTPDNGVWNIQWKFISTDRGWVLDDLTYFRPGGKGCH